MIGQLRRLASIGRAEWVDAMVLLLARLHTTRIKVNLGLVGVRLQKATGMRSARYRWNEPGFHRWHDSGDLQSVSHLEKIIEICERTPQIVHWLPTRELSILRSCQKSIPPNLTIRVSATMIDGAPPATPFVGSTVHTNKPALGAHVCPAPTQGHECKTCRACWSKDVPLVSYALH